MLEQGAICDETLSDFLGGAGKRGKRSSCKSFPPQNFKPQCLFWSEAVKQADPPTQLRCDNNHATQSFNTDGTASKPCVCSTVAKGTCDAICKYPTSKPLHYLMESGMSFTLML